MSLDVLIFILVLSNLVLVSAFAYFAIWAYHSRERIRDRVVREANSYLQTQMDSIKEHPEALVKLFKPVLTKMLSDLSTESAKSSTEMVPQDTGNPLMSLGLSFVPTKYQFLAQLGLGLLQSRKSSTGPVQKDGKNPFE